MVDDVDRIFSRLMAAGVVVALEPTDHSWGDREMHVRDPDGSTLRFTRLAASDGERP
jgi:uncharacterized glyoxalase superfamily protein PhnB